MDREKIQSFTALAEVELASVRANLLIAAQNGDGSDLATPRQGLASIRSAAAALGEPAFEVVIGRCDAALDALSQNGNPAAASHKVLDLVSRIEAELWQVPGYSTEFDFDVSDFVDSSFDKLMLRSLAPSLVQAEPNEQFEADDETLEIFRAEADELLATIVAGINTLSKTPADQTALWDIRRSSHTLKGAAGIVGLNKASIIAHRMEDLLDKMVEIHTDAAPEVVDFLATSAQTLAEIVAMRHLDENGADLGAKFDSAMNAVSFSAPKLTKTSASTGSPVAGAKRQNADKPLPAPIVRVSLDRLDEIILMSRSLAVNRLTLAEKFADLNPATVYDPASNAKVVYLLDDLARLTNEIERKLRQIRMVRFGTLETRFNRAVNVACTDTGKKADLTIENADIEIDTRIIDALVEPLLHLLKNAVVHGIEPSETRRLIGKNERGRICIHLNADSESLALAITDDGSGISAARLKEKAVAMGILTQRVAETLDDSNAVMLVFERGLTTAGKIDLNAGRGVGMSIVRESIQGIGGTLEVETKPQMGTTFTIRLPLAVTDPETARSLAPKTALHSSTPLVLIVDDSASIRRATSKVVADAGFTVITAGDGAEALELLLSGEWEPDLILSDVEMPNINGWEFLEYVKTDQNFGHVPVVMVTSLDTDDDRTHALTLGASEYLIKPVSTYDLTLVLEKYCALAVA